MCAACSGMLCWGQLSNIQPLVDLHEYLLQAHAHLARLAPPPRVSQILGTALFPARKPYDQDCMPEQCQHPASRLHFPTRAAVVRCSVCMQPPR